MRRELAAALLAIALPAAADLPPAVKAVLSRAGVPASAVSALVVPLDGGAPAVSHNATAPMNPASVMKLITGYAALDLLGPAFTFRTDVLLTAEPQAGVLEGDLYIRAGGDPKLTYERVWQMLQQVRGRGIREIRGDVVVDRRYFAPAGHDPAGFDADPRRAYNVGADAFLVNFNAVIFRFVPDAAGVRVVAEPELPNVEIVSRLKPTNDSCVNYRAGLTHDVVDRGLLVTVSFGGNYPIACGERAWPLSVLDNARFGESHVRWLWSAVGGVLRGRVRDGPVPDGARLLHRHDSEPLANLVRDMNKHSNNVMARHIFLALSAEPLGRDGEARASAQRLAEWLRARRIAAPELVVENGSGLSRNERASVATLAAVLKSAWTSALMPEVVSSLPILGVDGTLKSRVGGASAKQAHLKGGTLADVQSIAGYVLDRNGRRWSVAMTINHPRAGAAQPALDALVEWTHQAAARHPRGKR